MDLTSLFVNVDDPIHDFVQKYDLNKLKQIELQNKTCKVKRNFSGELSPAP